MSRILGSFPLQLFCFLAIWLLFLEATLRLFLISPTRVIADPVLGWRYPANATFRMAVADTGYTEITTNSLGLVGRPLDANDRRRRILVLGDSFTEALQVPRASTFVSLLDRANRSLQFIGAGRSGLDPLIEGAFATQLTPVVHPLGVIMVIDGYDGEEIPYDTLTLKRCPPTGIVCDYMVKPTYRGSFRRAVNAIEKRSALVTLLAQKYQLSSLCAVLSGIPLDAQQPSASGGQSISDADIEPLLEVALARIAQHYPLLVVYIPILDYGVDRTVREGASDLVWKRQVQAAAKTVGAGFVDTEPALASSYKSTGQPPVGFDFDVIGDGHLNAAGHMAVARFIESHLGMFATPEAGK